MNPDIKRRWVEALRSGDYEQGEGRLSYELETDPVRRHCCLGVLCDLAEKDGVVEGVEITIGALKYMKYESATAYLPWSVIKWAMLATDHSNTLVSDDWSSNPRVQADGTTVALTALNDRGIPFAQIADFIEESL